MRLFLFDVDGTLVTAHGAGRLALGRALLSVYGTAGPIETYDFRGRTDPWIVTDLMTAAGVAEADVRARLAACLAAYVRELDALISDGHRVDVLPGVAEVVRGLAAREDTVVGLLTGNVEAGARVKLRPTGLWSAFRMGAYGSDDADRRRLPVVARARAQALTGHAIPFDRVTVIGDTPLDVDCGRACGTRVAAVATGWHSVAELAACGPDHLFVDLSRVDDVLAALLAG